MTHDYRCLKCGKVQEWNTSKSLPKEMQVPEACPDCGGALEQLWSATTRVAVDVPGGYDYEYGKKAWRRNMSTVEQAMVLNGDKDPY
jgi:DNA-directed RNA polymerase subunit RPC12/RpoP